MVGLSSPTNMHKFLLFTFLFLSFASHTLASTTSGTITSPQSFAWSENAGWIDFVASSSAITITDSALTGYAFAESLGWISLNCSNTSSCGTVDYKVSNNAEGVLSGNAWSENAGWIDFASSGSGVIINSTGEFTGYAYGENIGWINFDIDEGLVTDWRPLSVRNSGAATTTPTTRRHSSSGRSASPAVVAVSTPFAAVCLPGFLFNPQTGAPCPVSINPAPTFTRDLTLGSTGEDVKALQIYLNTHGFLIASTGPGSFGQETTYFGVLTKNALRGFQSAKGIVPSVGYFGMITRTFVLSQ